MRILQQQHPSCFKSSPVMRLCNLQLVFGERRWFLTPPRFAKVRTGSVIDWYKQDYQNASQRADHSMIELIQRPGEMLYIPAGWGHAVINTANVVRCAWRLVLRGSPQLFPDRRPLFYRWATACISRRTAHGWGSDNVGRVWLRNTMGYCSLVIQRT
jgi:hypothetical protein